MQGLNIIFNEMSKQFTCWSLWIIAGKHTEKSDSVTVLDLKHYKVNVPDLYLVDQQQQSFQIS